MKDNNSAISLLDTDFQVVLQNGIKKNQSNPLDDEVSPKPAILDDNKYENWWLEAIGATNLEYNGSGVKVAILDTGIYTSTDYNVVKNVWFINGETGTSDAKTIDEFGHGTHVAGIIGGNGDGSDGKYRGVAPGVSLYNVKLSGDTGGILDEDVVNAVQWCINEGVDIISMSFSDNFPIVYDSITEVLSEANNYGIICVASAGNSGPEYFTGGSPASGINIISVGATDKNNSLASFSSIGPTVSDFAYPDVVAPGVDIISVEAKNSVISRELEYVGDYFDYPGETDYIPLSGTSMACPMVSGALALLLEAYPDLTPETARIALMEGATKLTDSNDAYYLKSGAGLINVTASLEYLNKIENDPSRVDINDTAKILPEFLPIKPYDFLHFPGDHQKFNLSILSGTGNTYDIELPTIPGVTLTLDYDNLYYNDAGINFTALDIMIDFNATPSIGSYKLNLTSGGEVYDSIDITLDIRIPEYNILMESYHGLNDWFPEISFYQMGFYEAMNAISEMNISIKYFMEYWTPNYNKSTDNSILTEELLSQYDLIILQNPILPYSPLEINNLINYFNNGGNILFLGTLYQDLCLDNINELFSLLGSGIEINEENIINENWEGIGASIYSQLAIVDNTNPIFNGVNTFLWFYGSSFTCSSDPNTEAIATINEKTIAATYNGTNEGKGKLVAFGDLHWLFTEFTYSLLIQDHMKILSNLMEYYFFKDDMPYSININMPSEAVSNPIFNISIYIKNQISEIPINSSILSSTNLTVIIENNTKKMPIIMNSSKDGVAFNNTIDLSNNFIEDSTPLTIRVNLTIGSITYNKTIKLLYFNQSAIPQIYTFASNSDILNKGDYFSLNSTISQQNCVVMGFMSIYTYSYFNSKQTINRTLNFINNVYEYSINTQILSNDPSGYGIVYLIANSTSNYINSKSPRIIFQILNKNPKIINSSSSCEGIILSSTQDDKGNFIDYISSSQGSSVNFNIYTEDVEDDSVSIRVSVNLIICSLYENTIYLIDPSIYPVAELSYSSGLHSGYFVIPYSMQYNSIEGSKMISTVANNDNGYIGLFIITIMDTEGGTDEFYLLVIIQPGYNMALLIIVIVITILSIIGGLILFLYFRSRRRSRISNRTQYYQDYYRPSPYDDQEVGGEYYSEKLPFKQPETRMSGAISCPNCGEIIDVPKKFCPHCGKSILSE